MSRTAVRDVCVGGRFVIRDGATCPRRRDCPGIRGGSAQSVECKTHDESPGAATPHIRTLRLATRQDDPQIRIRRLQEATPDHWPVILADESWIIECWHTRQSLALQSRGIAVGSAFLPHTLGFLHFALTPESSSPLLGRAGWVYVVSGERRFEVNSPEDETTSRPARGGHCVSRSCAPGLRDCSFGDLTRAVRTCCRRPR